MENQEVNQSPEVEFLSDDQVPNLNQDQSFEQPAPPEFIDLDAAMEADNQTQEISEEVSEEQIDNTEEQSQENIGEQDIEYAVLQYLSERLGREVLSLEDLALAQQESVLDERLQVISKFMEDTGRDPSDWFRYQQLNPSEMDDMMAVRLNMMSQYQDLTSDEINTLINSKYKLDADLHTEDEVKLSALQLKIDAQAARENISSRRDSYMAPLMTPERQETESSPIDETWIQTMRSELNSLEGVEFDLGDGKKFTFGLTSEYKNSLADKNTRLDEYFDPYVREDVSWDYDMLNMHRSVIDNIDTIVQSVYKQGMADGQRGIVDRAANVNAKSPNQGGAQPGESSLASQLREALGGSNLRFR